MILDIVVDVQKDFITGALANPQAQANVTHLAETVKAHARAGHWLFLTRDTHPDNYLATREGRHLPVEHCIEGEDGWNFAPELENALDGTGTSPCKTACPAHIAVQGYLKLAAQGKYREALQLIKRENPFPAVCGRICNRRCEDACTRGTVDQAVAIDEVKRFIAQQDLNAETRFVPEKVIPKVDGEFSEKIAVIGGGPAGLSCAY